VETPISLDLFSERRFIYFLANEKDHVKQGTTVRIVGWACMQHPVSNVTIWRPTSRGVKRDPGSTGG
jgi:hypothetical protein